MRQSLASVILCRNNDINIEIHGANRVGEMGARGGA